MGRFKIGEKLESLVDNIDGEARFSENEDIDEPPTEIEVNIEEADDVLPEAPGRREGLRPSVKLSHNKFTEGGGYNPTVVHRTSCFTAGCGTALDMNAASAIAQYNNIEASQVTKQYGVKQGIKIFGDDGVDAVLEELKQVHEREVVIPTDPRTMSKEMKQKALPYPMFLKRKRCGKIKGRLTKRWNRIVEKIVNTNIVARLTIMIVLFSCISTIRMYKFADRYTRRLDTEPAMDRPTSSSPRNNTSSFAPPLIPQEYPLLNCTEITKLEIVNQLGVGKRKVTYAVRLPNGQLGVAKRCRSAKCVARNLTINEGAMFKEMYKENGQHASIRFYGDCHGKPLEFPRRKRYIRRIQDDFSVGYTAVVEMGKPMLAGWTYNGSDIDTDCFAGFFTQADVADLTDIARRYAMYSRGPLLLGRPNKFTDNIFPQQYVSVQRTRIDDRNVSIHVTSIQHSDVDMLVRCREHYGDNCTYEWSLEYNCGVIAKLVQKNRTDLDCANKSPPSAVDPNGPRINTTLALLSCLI